MEKPVIFLTKEEFLHLYNFKIPRNGTKVKLTDMYGKEYTKTVEDAGCLPSMRTTSTRKGSDYQTMKPYIEIA